MLIDLKRLWEITLVICNEIDEVCDEDFHINYTTQYSFESFLNYFSIANYKNRYYQRGNNLL